MNIIKNRKRNHVIDIVMIHIFSIINIIKVISLKNKNLPRWVLNYNLEE